MNDKRIYSEWTEKRQIFLFSFLRSPLWHRLVCCFDIPNVSTVNAMKIELTLFGGKIGPAHWRRTAQAYSYNKFTLPFTFASNPQISIETSIYVWFVWFKYANDHIDMAFDWKRKRGGRHILRLWSEEKKTLAKENERWRWNVRKSELKWWDKLTHTHIQTFMQKYRLTEHVVKEINSKSVERI